MKIQFRFLGIFLLVAAGFYPSAEALQISGVGGLSLAKSEVTATGLSTANTSSYASYGGGVLLDFPLGHVLSFEIGGLYVQRKLGQPITAALQNSSAQQLMKTIQVPAMLRIGLLKLISVGAGGYYSFGQGNVQNTVGSLASESSYAANNFQSKDYGLVGSVRIMLPLIPKIGLLFDGRYLFGLYNTSTLSGVTVKTRDVQVLAGVYLNL